MVNPITVNGYRHAYSLSWTILLKLFWAILGGVEAIGACWGGRALRCPSWGTPICVRLRATDVLIDFCVRTADDGQRRMEPFQIVVVM